MEGLSPTIVRLAYSMIATVPLSAGIRLFKHPTWRHVYALLAGLLLVWYPCRTSCWIIFPPMLYTYMVMLAAPKRCGTLTWLGVAPYLLCWHAQRLSPYPQQSEESLACVGLMMWGTFKSISIATCYQEYHTKDAKDLYAYQAAHVFSQLPTPLEFLSYMFGLGSLLVGPWNEFKPYKEFIERQGVWSSKATTANKPTRWWWAGCKTFLVAAVFFWLWITFRSKRGGYVLLTGRFYRSSLVMKFLLMWQGMYLEQFTLPFIWLTAEAAATMSGFNLIGWDEKGDAQWGRCRNINYLRNYVTDTARDIPRVWNISTAVFLKRYVYERLPLLGQKRPSDIQAITTQMVCALWHGFEAGYIHFFMGTILMGHFSTTLYKLENRFAPKASQHLLWRAFKIVSIYFQLAYFGSAYVLGKWFLISYVWEQMYYSMHIMLIVGTAVGRLTLRLAPAQNLDPSLARKQMCISETELSSGRVANRRLRLKTLPGELMPTAGSGEEHS